MENPKGGLGGQLPITGPGNLPPGGTTGQELVKLSNADDDTGWANGTVLGNFGADHKTSVVSADIPADGAIHTPTPAFAAPPAWLSAAGIILQEGLYLIIYKISQTNAFTTANSLIAVNSAFNAINILSSDWLAITSNTIEDAQSLDSGDVPWDNVYPTQILMPTDLTGTITLQVAVSRLAH